jgi:hypothetical protein
MMADFKTFTTPRGCAEALTVSDVGNSYFRFFHYGGSASISSLFSVSQSDTHGTAKLGRFLTSQVVCLWPLAHPSQASY